MSNNGLSAKELVALMDELVRSPNPLKRKIMASRGYGLDVLVNDPEWEVRAEVAAHAYGLDKLCSDAEPCVRVFAGLALRHLGLSLEGWIRVFPNKCALPENRQDTGQRHPPLSAVISGAQKINGEDKAQCAPIKRDER